MDGPRVGRIAAPFHARESSVTDFALSAGSSSAALHALHHAISTGQIELPADGRVLFLRARDGLWWGGHSRQNWLCEQSFKPFATALERSGMRVGLAAADQRFPRVLLFHRARAMSTRPCSPAPLRTSKRVAIVAAAMAMTKARFGLRRISGSFSVMHRCCPSTLPVFGLRRRTLRSIPPSRGLQRWIRHA